MLSLGGRIPGSLFWRPGIRRPRGKSSVSWRQADQYSLWFLIFVMWLTDLHVDASGNADLAAHFFRRAFGLVHAKGTFGFVATNTISQGDTRAAGLRWLRRSGAVIYDAVKRVRWPGQASVVVSTVILSRGRGFARSTLNHRQVDRITAFLFHRGSDEDPVRLGGENERAYIGHFLRGMGFTFDDDSEKATPSLVSSTFCVMNSPASNKLSGPILVAKRSCRILRTRRIGMRSASRIKRRTRPGGHGPSSWISSRAESSRFAWLLETAR